MSRAQAAVEAALGRSLPPLTFVPELPFRLSGGLYLVEIPGFVIKPGRAAGQSVAEPTGIAGERRPVERRAVPTLDKVSFLVRHYFDQPINVSDYPGVFSLAIRLSSIDRGGRPTGALRPLALGLHGAPEDTPSGIERFGAAWVCPDVVRGLFPPPAAKTR